MATEAIELLVTVKAYPAISLKYGEVVCVAGIRTDVADNAWIRLYPIAFRDLEFARRFRKYSFISLKAERHSTDTRPESMRPNTDSLRVGSKLDTKQGWRRRREIVEPLLASSMCWIQAQQLTSGMSLGAFRPGRVDDLEITPEPSDWEPKQAQIANQPSLMFPAKQALERIPYRFRYVYSCPDEGCPGHRQSIIDWEIHQAFRDWRSSYGEAEALTRIREKWLSDICSPEKDTAFFVGNMHLRPDQFLVLGTFWPPRSA